MADLLVDEAPLEIECPRCRSAVTVRFYGPCDACRTTLRSEQGNQARTIQSEVYEPKMNVTPNAVALKD